MKSLLKPSLLRHSQLWLSIGLFCLLAACAPMPSQNSSDSAKLGTQWGEGLESRVTQIQAHRITPDQPEQIVSIAYSDARALTKKWPDAARQLNLPLLQGAIELSVLDEKEQPMPLLRTTSHDPVQLGGINGTRYILKLQNMGNGDYEIITTVDGLDVLNGKPGSLQNSGYILKAYSSLTITGFRKSKDEVAAFRFAAPSKAYAANTAAGDIRNLGIIGVAVFRLALEDLPRAERLQQPNPFPADKEYAPAPRY